MHSLRSRITAKPLYLLGLCCFLVACSQTKPLASYDQELAMLDIQLEASRTLAARQTNWLVWERVASGYLSRARLTASFDDYAAAAKALENAFELAPEGSGPIVLRAQLNITLHRLGAAERDVELLRGAAYLLPTSRAQLDLLNGDLALQRERFEEAKEHFDRAAESLGDASLKSRRALLAVAQGRFIRADTHFAELIAGYSSKHGEPLAWLHLQRGLIDLQQSQLPQALAHYHQAAQSLSGWWLVDEHIAEIDVLQGRASDAMRRYTAVVSRTDKPEFMDAIARLYNGAKQPTLAEPWIRRARERYEAEYRRFPEAIAGHAVEHYLAFAPASKRTLQLAEENYRARPTDRAKALLVQARLEH